MKKLVGEGGYQIKKNNYNNEYKKKKNLVGKSCIAMWHMPALIRTLDIMGTMHESTLNI